MYERLFITGSREATPGMLDAVRRAILNAKDLGMLVIVGDDEGVDSHVIEQCDALGVFVIVYGACGRMRNRTTKGHNVALDCTYSELDIKMAETGHLCLAIWNGQSEGTMIAYNAAKELGKKVYLVGGKA